MAGTNRIAVPGITLPRPSETYSAEDQRQMRRTLESEIAKITGQIRAGTAPTVLAASATVQSDGTIRVVLHGNTSVLSFRYVVSTSSPADATIQAASPSNGQDVTATVAALSGPGGFLSVFPYALQNGVGEQGARVDVQFSTVPMALAQGTVAVSASGAWDATPDLPASAHSLRWSASTSGYPADATVAASGTLISSTTNPVSGISGSGLTFGQTILITIVPFTGSSGGGVQLSPIHIRGAFLTYTASKTTTFSPAAWQGAYSDPSQPAIFDWRNNAYAVPPCWAANTSYWALPFLIPDAVTITNVAYDSSGWVSAPFTIGAGTFRVVRLASGTPTSIGSTTISGSGTFNVGLSESSSGRSYQAQVELDNYQPNGGLLPPITFGEIGVTYTMGNPSTTV